MHHARAAAQCKGRSGDGSLRSRNQDNEHGAELMVECRVWGQERMLSLQVNGKSARASPRSRLPNVTGSPETFLRNHINHGTIQQTLRTDCARVLKLHPVRNSHGKVRLVRERAYCPRKGIVRRRINPDIIRINT